MNKINMINSKSKVTLKTMYVHRQQFRHLITRVIDNRITFISGSVHAISYLFRQIAKAILKLIL